MSAELPATSNANEPTMSFDQIADELSRIRQDLAVMRSGLGLPIVSPTSVQPSAGSFQSTETRGAPDSTSTQKSFMPEAPTVLDVYDAGLENHLRNMQAIRASFGIPTHPTELLKTDNETPAEPDSDEAPATAADTDNSMAIDAQHQQLLNAKMYEAAKLYVEYHDTLNTIESRQVRGLDADLDIEAARDMLYKYGEEVGWSEDKRLAKDAALLDSLDPEVLPLERYNAWIDTYTAEAQGLIRAGKYKAAQEAAYDAEECLNQLATVSDWTRDDYDHELEQLRYDMYKGLPTQPEIKSRSHLAGVRQKLGALAAGASGIAWKLAGHSKARVGEQVVADEQSKGEVPRRRKLLPLLGVAALTGVVVTARIVGAKHGWLPNIGSGASVDSEGVRAVSAGARHASISSTTAPTHAATLFTQPHHGQVAAVFSHHGSTVDIPPRVGLHRAANVQKLQTNFEIMKAPLHGVHDSAWRHASQALGGHATDKQIIPYLAKIKSLNSLSNSQIRNIPVGFHLLMPRR